MTRSLRIRCGDHPDERGTPPTDEAERHRRVEGLAGMSLAALPGLSGTCEVCEAPTSRREVASCGHRSYICKECAAGYENIDGETVHLIERECAACENDAPGYRVDARRRRGLSGDLMHCVQYAKTPRGATRCITMRAGPGTPPPDARAEAGLTHRYRYDTKKAQTRGRPAKAPGIDRYPRVYHGQDARRVSVGQNVPVPPPAAVVASRERGRAVAGLAEAALDPGWRADATRSQFQRQRGGRLAIIQAASGGWRWWVVAPRPPRRGRSQHQMIGGGTASSLPEAQTHADYWLTSPAADLGAVDPKQAIRLIADAIVESVAVAGDQGAPAGVIYSAMLHHLPGLTADAFNQFIGALVAAGRLRRSGHLLFVVK